jgi:diguanylate cyclase
MQYYSLEDYVISIISAAIAAYFGLIVIKRLPKVKNNTFILHKSSIVFSLLIFLTYLYSGLSEIHVDLNVTLILLLFFFVLICTNFTINTICLETISLIRLLVAGLSFACCIIIINMIDFISEIITNELKINLLLVMITILLASSNTIASIRFIRQIRKVNHIHIRWRVLGSITIGMAFASLRFTLFSSGTIFSNISLFNNSYINFFEWSYFDKTLLPLTINIAALAILELVPGTFGDQHNEEQALIIRESKQKYQALFANQAVAIFSLNNKGNIKDANPAAEKMTGYQYEQLINFSFVEKLINTKTKVELENYFQDCAKGCSAMFETTITTIDNKILHVQITLIPILVNNQVTGINLFAKDITETIEAQKQINYVAYHDPLTGLPNRRYFSEALQKIITQRKKEKAALLYLDIDRFKAINDLLGHNVGDQLLIQLAQRIQNHLPSHAIVGRMGGDEFTILLTKIHSKTEVKQLAYMLIREIRKAFYIDDQELYVTASMGITLFPNDSDIEEELMKYADLAMYRAKDRGKDAFEFFNDELFQITSNHLTLEKDLRKALLYEEFEVYYQPQLNLNTNKIISVEALIRWNHPERGMVSPNEFIPIAEETNLINDIGRWILFQACKQIKLWHEEGLTDLRISVNISFLQLYHKHFVSSIKEILSDTKLAPRYLDLEITESMTMKDMDHAITIFTQLKRLGVSISIDDFGKGYSSLNHLKTLPIDRIKIDGSFTEGIPFDKESIIILKNIIQLSQNLHLTALVEHVETEEQLDFLKDLHCNEIQGYHISAPLPSQKVYELLTKQQYNKSKTLK